MTRIWAVRHGPTHHKGMVGHSDIPADLSDVAGLSRLQSALPDRALVLSSDLDRAVKTADAIQGSRQRLPHDPRFREINFGDWETKTFADVSKTDPDLSASFWQNPGDIAPPNGESWNKLRRRISDAIEDVVARNSTQDIVIVAHFGAILSMIQHATDMETQTAFSFTIKNLSLTRLEHLGDKGWRVDGVNHVL